MCIGQNDRYQSTRNGLSIQNMEASGGTTSRRNRGIDTTRRDMILCVRQPPIGAVLYREPEKRFELLATRSIVSFRKQLPNRNILCLKESLHRRGSITLPGLTFPGAERDEGKQGAAGSAKVTSDGATNTSAPRVFLLTPSLAIRNRSSR